MVRVSHHGQCALQVFGRDARVAHQVRHPLLERLHLLLSLRQLGLDAMQRPLGRVPLAVGGSQPRVGRRVGLAGDLGLLLSLLDPGLETLDLSVALDELLSRHRKLARLFLGEDLRQHPAILIFESRLLGPQLSEQQLGLFGSLLQRERGMGSFTRRRGCSSTG